MSMDRSGTAASLDRTVSLTWNEQTKPHKHLAAEFGETDFQVFETSPLEKARRFALVSSDGN